MELFEKELQEVFGMLSEPEEDVYEDEEEEEEIRQIFPSHDALGERLRKTMYYGESLPSSDNLSMSLTELSVQEFAKGEFRRLDQLSVHRAAWISQEASAAPTSLLMALLYLERLRNANPGYLAQTSSTDVFLVSLMVASKFLNDDGEEGEVFNVHWAASAGMDKSHINELEIKFLDAIDWKIFVSEKEFGLMLDKLEQVIARQHLRSRGWATYTDLMVLSNKCEFNQLLQLLYQYAFKVTAVCISAYTASIITMLGACCFLNSTPLGPQAVTDSMTTLLSLGSFNSVLKATPSSISCNSSSSVFDFPSIDESNDESIEEQESSIVQIISEDSFPWLGLDPQSNGSQVFGEGGGVVRPSSFNFRRYCQPSMEEDHIFRINLLTPRFDNCVGVR